MGRAVTKRSVKARGSVVYRKEFRPGDQVVLPKDHPEAPNCWGVVANVLPDGMILVEVSRSKKLRTKGYQQTGPFPVTIRPSLLAPRRGDGHGVHLSEQQFRHSLHRKVFQ